VLASVNISSTVKFFISTVAGFAGVRTFGLTRRDCAKMLIDKDKSKVKNKK
jgi:hypothetical protein